jgi:tetratricopeptide (TPR) repeat protein
MNEFEQTAQTDQPVGLDTLPAVEAAATESDSEAAIEPRPAAGGRWLLQFGVGALVVGGLVFGIGKRAELSSSFALARARQEMEQGRSYQAARELAKAFSKNKNDRAVEVALIEAYYRAGQPEQARPLANQIVLTPGEEKRIQPLAQKVEDAGDLLQQGRELIGEREWARALPLIQRAAQALPDSPLPHAMLAQTYGGLYFTVQKPQHLQGCIAEQKRLTEIDPELAAEIKKRLGPVETLPEVIKHTTAADNALKAGKPEAAVPELDAADKLYPNSAMVHALRAIIHAQRFEKGGSAEEKRLALEEYRTAVQLNPARAALRPRLGRLAKAAAD